VTLIILTFVGQLLVDVADPNWRSDFREQLSDLKGAMRARRASSNAAPIPDKTTEIAARREQAE
jgi:hypothetical protein